MFPFRGLAAVLGARPLRLPSVKASCTCGRPRGGRSGSRHAVCAVVASASLGTAQPGAGSPRPAPPTGFQPARVTWRVVLRSVQVFGWFATYLVFFVVVLGPWLWVFNQWWDRDRRLARRIVRALYRHGMHGFCGRNLWIAPFDWRVVPQPCILVANHQSAIDILLLLQLPPDARCWAKNWPFRMPFLGALMKLCGHLHVQHADVLEQAAESLRRGVSLYVFPEGTRSRNGRLGRFHDGAFLLAARTNCPIVPVAIHGSGRCMTPDHIAIFDVPLRVEPLGILYPDAISTPDGGAPDLGDSPDAATSASEISEAGRHRAGGEPSRQLQAASRRTCLRLKQESLALIARALECAHRNTES